MANKTYVAIFVPASVREKIKKKAKANNRTMIGQLTEDYESEKEALLAGADGPGGDQAHPAPGTEEGAALCPFSSRD